MILRFLSLLFPQKQATIVPVAPSPVPPTPPEPPKDVVVPLEIPKRIDRVAVTGLVSSYISKKTGKHFGTEALKASSFVCPDMFEALVKLDGLVRLNGGTLYITDLFREWAVQARLRKEYEVAKEDPNIKDKPFAAPPGGSFHQAGRAVDFDTKNLNFAGIEKDQQLDFFWTLAKPLGFRPIISLADEGMSENWHFDFPGNDWKDAYDKISYSEAAKCAILDVGNWNPDENQEKVRKMFIQAQLIRLGHYEIGKVDGIIGPKTLKILETLGLKDMDTKLQAAILAKKSR